MQIWQFPTVASEHEGSKLSLWKTVYTFTRQPWRNQAENILEVSSLSTSSHSIIRCYASCQGRRAIKLSCQAARPMIHNNYFKYQETLKRAKCSTHMSMETKNRLIGLKGLLNKRCPSLTTGSHAWLQKMAPLCSVFSITRGTH